MNVKFDYKVLLFRVATAGYTAFLAAFSKAYVAAPDLNTALHAGLVSAVAGVFAGFGLDQLVFHYTKNTNN
jgi:hypothetical protein